MDNNIDKFIVINFLYSDIENVKKLLKLYCRVNNLHLKKNNLQQITLNRETT